MGFLNFCVSLFLIRKAGEKQKRQNWFIKVEQNSKERRLWVEECYPSPLMHVADDLAPG